VTGVESERHLEIVVAEDKCSGRLENVYFTPYALADISSYLESMPGREVDDVKVAVVDAKLFDHSEPLFGQATEPILIEYVYGIQALEK